MQFFLAIPASRACLIRGDKEAVAETIENNVRRLIIDESPINPKYYERMSQLLDALIEQRKQEALDYQEYLRRIVELTRKAKNPTADSYPKSLNTPAKRAFYDNLGKSEELALAIDLAVTGSHQDEWRSNPFKVKKVRNAISAAIWDFRSRGRDLRDGKNPMGIEEKGEDAARQKKVPDEALVAKILELAKNQHEY
jgi:type I restriction enzyme R subunit